MNYTKIISSGLGILGLAALVVAFTTSFTSKPAKTEEKAPSITWYSYEEGSKLAEKKNKKIFIDVYTDWCGWCKQMDKTTFKDAKVIAYMNEKFIAVKLDAESAKSTVYQSKVLTERELALNILQANSYPTTAYLDERQNIIQPIPGYQDAATQDKIMHFFGDNHYKTKTWDQFLLEYQPK